MSLQSIILLPEELVPTRPFTNPTHISHYQRTLSYMAGQVCVLQQYPYLPANPPHVIFFNRPDNPDWFQRIVLAQPKELQQHRSLTIVGFFGHKRTAADMVLVHEFDRTLVAEIPDHPGLLSYSTMALDAGNYANLVIFADRAARDQWSRSQAHAQAVQQLSPNYYQTVTIVNGRLPHGIYENHDLQLIRAKYYDYQSQPRWQAVRELTENELEAEG